MKKAGTHKTQLNWPEDYIDQIIQGNNIHILRNMPEESVHCGITSPPYWGLRDYGTPPQVWGGQPDCEHQWGGEERGKRKDIKPKEESESKSRMGTDARQGYGPLSGGGFCRKCHAWLGNLGLEPTPDLFIDHIVLVFREVWRVLRNDGTFWLNMGDSYFTSGGHTDGDCKDRRGKYRIGRRPMSEYRKTKEMGAGMRLKNKDLVLMPARIAIALQEDGWYVRNRIIWAKLNCMPESVKDRCTVADEDIYLLTKNEKYFFDAEAIKEPVEASSLARVAQNNGKPNWNTDRQRGFTGSAQTMDINKMVPESGMRNKRTVWTVATQPYPEAHFATFPPKLITPCILAGTSESGCCVKCGAPWERQIKKENHGFVDRSFRSAHETGTDWNTNATGKTTLSQDVTVETLCWKPTCKCQAEAVPCTVLDPFGGAGTTAFVAAKYGRRSVSIGLDRPQRGLLHDGAQTNRGRAKPVETPVNADTRFRTIVADPPWRFANKSGKGSPEYRKKHRYQTMDLETICAMGPQVLETTADESHLYLWVPTALLNWGLQTMAAWGYDFKTSLFWHKVTDAGISDRSGMGFYYRNVIEPCLFGIRGSARTLLRNVPNIVHAPKTGHSRKPDAFYGIVERMSPGPYLELFARQDRPGWTGWGDQAPAGGVILITTHPGILPTWRETIGSVVTSRQGIMDLPEIYQEAETSAKVERAKRLGHRWKNQIRRTLQEHFRPAGYGRWAAA